MKGADIPCIDRELVMRADEIMRHLKAAKLSIITAESCTAGLISAVLAQAEGAGDMLHGSFVVYTKENKVMALGVDAALLKREGSVNAEVVRQLACGALDRSPAQLALAVSGVLGPEPDEDGNPVGLVYLACCRRGQEPRTLRKDYGKGSPEALRRATVLDALALIETCARL